nr:outer membrane beta-barrel protein [Lelliottia steviae]
MKHLFSLLILTASFSSQADTPYFGVDYMLSDIEISSESAKPTATFLRAGVSNKNMAFEAQYLVSSNDDDIYNINFDIDKSVGLYFVMQSNIVNGFGLDVSLGYAKTQMKVTSTSQELPSDYDYDGFAWGVAIHQEVPYIKNTHVRLAYQSLFEGDDVDISGVTLGFTYQF